MRRVRSQFLGPVLRLPFVVRRSASTVGRASLAGALGTLALTAGPALAADCPNADIRQQQGPAVEALPDCMALEMTSPPQKFSQSAHTPSVSANGDRVLFRARIGLGDAPNQFDLILGDLAVTTRTENGWVVRSTLPPVREGENWNGGWGGGTSTGLSFSPDFGRWVTYAATLTGKDSGAAQTFRADIDGGFYPLSPLFTPLDRSYLGLAAVNAAFRGASADHRRLYFSPGDLGMTYLAGDPSPLGSSATPNTYVAGESQDGVPGLKLLARDEDGKVWGMRCGARVGNILTTAGTFGVNGRNQGAVSGDGSRVLFTTRPEQTGGGACDAAANKLRILTRADVDGEVQISPLIAPECDRVSPACDTADGDDIYQGASVDGTKVYFTSTRQLTDSDLDVGSAAAPCAAEVALGCDLYLYDASRPVGDRLLQVSAGTAGSPTPGVGAGVHDGIAAISTDGSHAYFVAQGVLTNDANPEGATAIAGEDNLYSFTYDEAHFDGGLAFVGAVAATDAVAGGGMGTFKGGTYPVPAADSPGSADGPDGDGHVLFFESQSPLTPDDGDGGMLDLYRYDALADSLVRVSKAGAGGADNGPLGIDSRAGGQQAGIVGTDYAEFRRWASEDGDMALFRTAEGLLPEDTNGIADTYLWNNGSLFLLPGTAPVSGGSPGALTYTGGAAMSHDGSAIAFTSYSQLLASDSDFASDVYVARVDGGFRVLSVDQCDPLADACPDAGVDEAAAPVSTNDGGDGNAASGDRKRIVIAGLSRKTLMGASRSGVLALPVRTSEAGRIRATAKGRIGKRTRLVARAAVETTRPGKVTLRLRLSRAARQRLSRGRALKLSIEVAASNARPRTRDVRLPGASS